MVKYTKFLSLCLIATVLIGCSSNLSKFGLGSSTSNRPLTAEQYVQMARKTVPPQSTVHYLRAAELYIQAGTINEAKQALKMAQDDHSLNPELKQALLEARLSLLKRDNDHAIALVTTVLAKLDVQLGAERSQNVGGQYKIALLLPSKGQYAQAGKTIRDGFLAAYYKSKTNQSSDPIVQVYDTSDAGKINEAYQRAIADNSNVIVGPLTKQDVDTVANIPSTIPILALNTLADGKAVPRHLHQFGLLPEDEIAAVASLARRQGHRRALVIVPEGDWGKRMMTAFNQFWQTAGGSIADTLMLHTNREISSQIQAAITVKGKVSRQDIDMIFLAASPELARQIKPLLTYHGAERLPVYASASVYSGSVSPAQDQDLNGIQFCDMPSVLATEQQQDQLWAKNAASGPRYFALGMDAYYLALQLGANQPLYHPTGATGKLYFNQRQQRVQRTLVCSRFNEGVPVAIAD
jgi:outer membrane PBP1 activator LpoA protein